ncbi:hypothetical protein DVQ89_22590 [Yersinia enterocolitica]|nr:hypothetical protein [Yersinia enterocolitica]
MEILRASLGQPLRLQPASVLAGLAARAGLAGVALVLPPCHRLGGFHQHQGCGFAHVLTRSRPGGAALRLPGVPLTLLPAKIRATTDNEHRNKKTKTRRPVVTAAV